MSSNSSSRSSASNQTASQEAKPKQPLRPFTVTTAGGFVSRIRYWKPEKDDPVYFVRLNIINGVESGDDGKYVNRYQSVDVRVAAKLERLMDRALLVSGDSESEVADYNDSGFFFKELFCHFTIHDLHYSAIRGEGKNGDDKAFLNSRGYLTDITFGENS